MPTTQALLTGAPAAAASSAKSAGLAETTDRPILVATDGSESADAGFIAARLLAHRCGAPVEVLAVTEPAVLHLPTTFPMAPTPDIDVLRMEDIHERAQNRLHAMVGDDPGWRVETRYGEAAPTIQYVARERRAGLIVTGLSRHGMMDRIYGEETNAAMIQLTTAPLLAVAGGFDRLPRSIVVAIDPHTSPLDESVVVRTLLSEVTTARFVCVFPAVMEMGQLLPSGPWEPSYAADVQAAYERARASMHLPEGAATELVTLVGNPAQDILRIAAEVKADLIIVGQRRRSILWRWIDKGLATRLLRGASCSLLVVPRPRWEEAQRTRSGRTQTIVDPSEFPARLAELSQRNTGRRVTLEIDDPEFGAQAQVTNYPFLGMDYDRSDDRLTIMLGDPAGDASHLSHTVSSPLAVEILDGRDGRTAALRIEQAMGQTLLMFVL